MIELDYQLGCPYRPTVIFAVLANVADYPAGQGDVLAARVQGGGPARRGGVVVRKVLGRSEHFRMYVDECEQDRELALKAVTTLRHFSPMRSGSEASPL